jgi:hypothetical protein
MENKKETLEEKPAYYELVDKKANENNTIDLNAYAVGVEEGAKWQADRMYSEKDMHKYAIYILTHKKVLNPNEWREQYKKKQHGV